MFDAALNRRQMLAGLGLGAAATLFVRPEWALASAEAEAHWPGVAAYLDKVVTEKKLPGALAAIGRGTGPLDVIGRGRQAEEADAPTVNVDTLWRLYSQTKPVTGMGAMILIGEGKLKLDQPIADFIPAYANMKVQNTPDGAIDDLRPAKTLITVRHLLTHTAGLGYTIAQKGPIKKLYEQEGINPYQFTALKLPGTPPTNTPPSLAEFAEKLATLPLIYEPGTRWSYSVSLDLLGRIIELASGMPFDAFLKARIFDPLGMTSTSFVTPQSDLGRLSTLYAEVGGARFPIDTPKLSIFAQKPAFPFGGAGLVGSARDCDRFLQMLLGEGKLGDTRIMEADIARLAMSNLLPEGTETSGTYIAGNGFGAGGRVTLASADLGESTFGWGGAAGTIGAVDRGRKLRIGGFIQIVPSEQIQFVENLSKAVRADLGDGHGGYAS